MIVMEFTVGVYGSGPIWGRIIDSNGPRIPLASAFLLLLGGYSGIKFIYDSGIRPGTSTIDSFTFFCLVVCGFMTGFGGNGGLQAAVNTAAKTYPDRTVS